MNQMQLTNTEKCRECEKSRSLRWEMTDTHKSDMELFELQKKLTEACQKCEVMGR